MPDQISVSEFVAETHEDYKAPTASSFTTRTAQCRNTVAAIEEVRAPGGPRRADGRAAGSSAPALPAAGPSPAPSQFPHPGKSFSSSKPDAAGLRMPETEALCSV